MDRTSEERFPWMLVLAAFLVIGLLSATGSLSMQRMESQPVRLGPLLLGSIVPWLYWGVAAWPIFLLVRRFPVPPPRAANLLAHLGLALVLVVIQVFITVWVNRLLFAAQATRQESFMYWVGAYVANRGVWNLLVYAGLAGLFQAIDTRNRLRRQELSSAQLETQLAQARLTALHQQLQPHFLFNTLHAIGVLNREDPARATRMIAALGDLLRSSLETREENEIPLARELALLEQYLEIESIRFSDRLTVSVTVPDELRAALVPPFSLQPLVENAIKHGVSRITGPSVIRLAAHASNGTLHLMIWNSGPPLALHRTAEGVGLATTRARLSRLYGPAGGIELANHEGGVQVSLRLPYRGHGAH